MTTRFANVLKALAIVALAVSISSCEDETERKTYGNWYQTYSYFPVFLDDMLEQNLPVL